MWKNKIKKAKQAEPESPSKEQIEQIETENNQQEQRQEISHLSYSNNINIVNNNNNTSLGIEEEGVIVGEGGGGGGNEGREGSNNILTKRSRQYDEVNNNNNLNGVNNNNYNNNNNNHNNNNNMTHDLNTIHNNNNNHNNHLNNNGNDHNIHSITHNTSSPSTSDDHHSKRIRVVNNGSNNSNNNEIVDTYGSINSEKYNDNNIINNNSNNNNNHNNNNNINMNEESMQSIHYQYESRNLKASKRDQNWDSQFEALLAYANKHKHCNVRTGYLMSEEEKPHVNLYAWLALQRRHKKQNKLRPDREKKLQSLVDAGMLSWSGSDSNSRNEDDEEYIHVLPPPPPPSWESHFTEVLIYAELYGHANVPIGYLVTVDKRKDIDLGQWLEDQRKQYSRKLPDTVSNYSKLNILADEGRFSWQTPRILPTISQQILDAKWSYRFEAMRNFISQEDNRNVCLGDNIKANLVVPIPEVINNSHTSSHGAVEVFDLGLWITAQRKCYAAGILNERRKSLLQLLVDANQFTWQSKEEAARISAEDAKRSKEEEALWNAWYNALVWQGNHVGHCNLDSHGTITLPDGSEAELGKWLHIQRAHIKKGKLRLDRAKKIKKLFDEGKLHPSRWAHVFTLSYSPNAFDDNNNNNTNNNNNININDHTNNNNNNNINNNDSNTNNMNNMNNSQQQSPSNSMVSNVPVVST